MWGRVGVGRGEGRWMGVQGRRKRVSWAKQKKKKKKQGGRKREEKRREREKKTEMQIERGGEERRALKNRMGTLQREVEFSKTLIAVLVTA